MKINTNAISIEGVVEVAEQLQKSLKSMRELSQILRKDPSPEHFDLLDEGIDIMSATSSALNALWLIAMVDEPENMTVAKYKAMARENLDKLYSEEE